MQLLGPQFNNNGSCKTKPNAKLTKAKQEHEQWLLKNGVHPTQLKSKNKTNSRGKLKSTFSAPVTKLTGNDFASLGITGLKKGEQKYTGNKLIGIAVMHKSCLQPVFSKESAKDSANMRRG
jgi:hypothetical protein